MGALYIAGSLCATIPAIFLGVNNGFTLFSVIVMAFAGVQILRGAR